MPAEMSMWMAEISNLYLSEHTPLKLTFGAPFSVLRYSMALILLTTYRLCTWGSRRGQVFHCAIVWRLRAPSRDLPRLPCVLFWLTGGLRKRGEIGGKALQWELHSRFELPSPLQSAWCKLNEVHLPLPLHPSHSPSAERAHAGGWQRYNQFAIHHCPYFNLYVWKWHWLLTPTLAIRAKRNIWRVSNRASWVF